MVNLIQDLKHRARLLHGEAQAGDAIALARLRRLPELSEADDAALAAGVRRRHCLGVLAAELGFRGWPHARAVLAGEPVADRGTLMYRDSGGSYWNIWSADYDEAAGIREAHGGYLLPYARQFVIVEDHFIESLGIDPRDPDWRRIAHDWVRPSDRDAWSRLTRSAIDARLAGSREADARTP